MDDVRAVLDAVGSRRAVLLGISEGGPMCSLFAATHPSQTEALIMSGGVRALPPVKALVSAKSMASTCWRAASVKLARAISAPI